MADGDLSMTVTVEGATVPLLVTNPRTGRGADDRRGTAGQESNGSTQGGQTGTVS